MNTDRRPVVDVPDIDEVLKSPTVIDGDLDQRARGGDQAVGLRYPVDAVGRRSTLIQMRRPRALRATCGVTPRARSAATKSRVS